MVWLSPQEWAQNFYQQRNPVMVIGSGGLWGKGLGNDSPLSVKSGNFLPRPHADLIMTVTGEKLGLWGCPMILLFLALTVEECIRVGLRTKDLSGRLTYIDVAVLIAGQSFVNPNVATGLLSNIGPTLSFVSYGLTSLMSLYLGLGLALNAGLQGSPFLLIPPW